VGGKVRPVEFVDAATESASSRILRTDLRSPPRDTRRAASAAGRRSQAPRTVLDAAPRTNRESGVVTPGAILITARRHDRLPVSARGAGARASNAVLAMMRGENVGRMILKL
jgi:hypothetical protein